MNKFIKSGKIISTFLGFFVGALSVYTFYATYYENEYGAENDSIQIVNAYLLPRYGFNKLKDFTDVSELRFAIKNFGNKTIHLTSASTKIINTSVIFHKSIGGGDNYLDEEPEKSDSIIIEPGEYKEVKIAIGFYLPGMLNYIKGENFKKAFYSNIGPRHMIHDYRLIDALNNKMTNLYGEDAGVEIRFFSNYKKLIRTHEIYFSQGTNMFGLPGKLRQEYFIGEVLSMLYGKKSY